MGKLLKSWLQPLHQLVKTDIIINDWKAAVRPLIKFSFFSIQFFVFLSTSSPYINIYRYIIFVCFWFCCGRSHLHNTCCDGNFISKSKNREVLSIESTKYCITMFVIHSIINLRSFIFVLSLSFLIRRPSCV